MNVEDWSTRKLKRGLYKYLRKVWYYDHYGWSLGEPRKTLARIKKELEHRGWTV